MDLVRMGAPLDEHDREGKQPLHIACVKGLAIVVEEMVQQGAPLMTLDKAGFNPLNYALRYSNDPDGRMKNAIVAIFKHPTGRALVTPDLTSASFKTMDFKTACAVALAWRDDESPLHIASRYLDPKLLADLTRGGMDVNMVNASGNTPLHLVALGRPHFLNEWRHCTSHNLDVTLLISIKQNSFSSDYPLQNYVIYND
jgi:ankyrin repeat protein